MRVRNVSALLADATRMDTSRGLSCMPMLCPREGVIADVVMTRFPPTCIVEGCGAQRPDSASVRCIASAGVARAPLALQLPRSCRRIEVRIAQCRLALHWCATAGSVVATTTCGAGAIHRAVNASQTTVIAVPRCTSGAGCITSDGSGLGQRTDPRSRCRHDQRGRNELLRVTAGGRGIPFSRSFERRTAWSSTNGAEAIRSPSGCRGHLGRSAAAPQVLRTLPVCRFHHQE